MSNLWELDTWSLSDLDGLDLPGFTTRGAVDEDEDENEALDVTAYEDEDEDDEDEDVWDESDEGDEYAPWELEDEILTVSG